MIILAWEQVTELARAVSICTEQSWKPYMVIGKGSRAVIADQQCWLPVKPISLEIGEFNRIWNIRGVQRMGCRRSKVVRTFGQQVGLIQWEWLQTSPPHIATHEYSTPGLFCHRPLAESFAFLGSENLFLGSYLMQHFLLASSPHRMVFVTTQYITPCVSTVYAWLKLI